MAVPAGPVILDSHGGLVSTTRPEELPQGASPRNNDVDYLVGRVIQRAGLKNEYSYTGGTYGPLGAATASGGQNWTTLSNILADDGGFTSLTYPLPPTGSTTVSATNGSSSGYGIPWRNVTSVAGTDAGSLATAVITAFSITTDVASFTSANSFVAGQKVTLSSMTAGTYFNSQVLTVLSTGLTSTTFQANFTHADVSSTLDNGIATPVAAYAIASQGPVSPGAGQHVANAYTSSFGASQYDAGAGLFAAFSAFANGSGVSGVNGHPFAPLLTVTGSVPAPNLPPASTIVSINPFATVTDYNPNGYSGSFSQFEVKAPSISYSYAFPKTGASVAATIGTAFPIDLEFESTGYATLEVSPGGSYPWATIASAYGVAVTYTSANAVPDDQLQTLGAEFNVTVPTTNLITGIAVTIQTGTLTGTGATLSAQLTIDGSPVGNPKTITPGTWADFMTLGGDEDSWGAILTGVQVSGGNLGILITGTLPAGQQLNLNNLAATVYYAPATTAIQLTNFPFSIPGTVSITGITVNVKGYADPLAAVYVQLLQSGVPVGDLKYISLSTTNGYVELGSPIDLWGSIWTPALITTSNFGVRLYTATPNSTIVRLDYVSVSVSGTVTNANFTGLMDANISQVDQITIALDANGISWEEDVTNNANVLTVNTNIPVVPAGSYLKGVDAKGIAYMAYSNLEQGTSQPMQWNGTNCDRITQVGPGAGAIFTASQSAGAQVAVTHYSYSSGILTLTTGTQACTAGELVTFSGFSAGCAALNGLTFSILGTGLTTTRIEIATALVAGSGSDTGTATPQYQYPIVASPLGIVQPPQMSDPASTGNLEGVLWSAGPGSTTAGNILTVYYSNQFHYADPDTVLVNAFNSGNPVHVWIQGAPVGNGCWQVTGVGTSIPPGGEYSRWYFTVQLTSSNYAYYGLGHAPGTYQMSQATVTTTTAVPGLAPGNQVSLAGVTNPSWDGVYTIVQALNSGSFAITQSSLTAGTATYTWSLTSGVAPTVGALVTVTNTLNANGTLNVVDAVVASVSGVSSGTFTVAGFSSALDYPTSVEDGQATTAGTQFIIDPGAALAGSTSQSPILGNSGGGTLSVVGASVGGNFPISAGTRQGVVFFITRAGAVTHPSPPTTFTVTNGANYITASNIPIGPPNTVARGIAFTEAGQNGVPGANFYTYDVPTTFTVQGTVYTASALIIPDNTTTTWKFTFSDYVLLNSDEIDIEGNNYFNLIELGDPVWMFQYADRMAYGLCNSKVRNFVNLSFDGGYIPTNSSTLPLPLGWGISGSGQAGVYNITAFAIASNIVTFTCDNSLVPGSQVLVQGLTTGGYLNGSYIVVTASSTEFTVVAADADTGTTADTGTVAVTSSSIGLVTSPDFGNSFQMLNLSGATWGVSLSPPTPAPVVLFQTAYEDVYSVRILQTNVPYSVRVKAKALNADAQTISVGLATNDGGVFTPVGSPAVFTYAQGEFVIQSAPITAGIPAIPTNLVLTVNAVDIAAVAGVLIDRIEVFLTDHPVDTTTIWMSYAGNFEAVDGVTGSLGVGTDNPQPAVGAYEILTQLFVEKTNSLVVTQDSPNYEPAQWTCHLANDKEGAVGPNAFDSGEEFSIAFTRKAVMLFDGGTRKPISRELQMTGTRGSLFDTINWSARKTIWLRNDLVARKVYIGIPMITPNFWLPDAPVNANPQSPNVILMLNYTGCPTPGEMEAAEPVHVTMFGDLKAPDMRRKYSLWRIACPGAEFVVRPDGTERLLLCNGIMSGKIYNLTYGAADGTGQNTDDGAAINWSYTTYGFTKPKEGLQVQGLGGLRKIWFYLTATMEGMGKIAATLYSNTLGATYPFTIPLPFTLQYPAQNDQERVLEIGGQRVFVEFKSIGTGGYAEVGTIAMDGTGDKWSPHRGIA